MPDNVDQGVRAEYTFTPDPHTFTLDSRPITRPLRRTVTVAQSPLYQDILVTHCHAGISIDGGFGYDDWDVRFLYNGRILRWNYKTRTRASGQAWPGDAYILREMLSQAFTRSQHTAYEEWCDWWGWRPDCAKSRRLHREASQLAVDVFEFLGSDWDTIRRELESGR